MAQESASVFSPPPRESRGNGGLPVGLVIAVAISLVLLAGIYWLGSRQPESQTPLAPSEEAIAYAEHLGVSNLHLSAEENFLGQEVIYLDGNVTNHGDKTVREIQVRIYFQDTLGQVILKEDRQVLGVRSAPLPPGESREFQIRFDRVPESWNLQVPQFQLLSVQVQ